MVSCVFPFVGYYGACRFILTQIFVVFFISFRSRGKLDPSTSNFTPLDAEKLTELQAKREELNTIIREQQELHKNSNFKDRLPFLNVDDSMSKFSNDDNLQQSSLLLLRSLTSESGRRKLFLDEDERR